MYNRHVLVLGASLGKQLHQARGSVGGGEIVGRGNSRDKVRSEEGKLLSLMMQMSMGNGDFI